MTTPTQTRIGSQTGGLRTEYVYVTDKDGNQQRTVQRSYSPVSTPKGVPRILGNREVIFGLWIVAMGLVSWDEWTTNGILPRPMRLWHTTWVYAGLLLLSISDRLLPIANALAFGYTLILVYQFFQGTGSFGAEGAAIAQGASEVGA
jgi:hypothetical protein